MSALREEIIAAFGTGKVAATEITEDEEPGDLGLQRWRIFGGVYDRTTIHHRTRTFAKLSRISPAFRDQNDGTPPGAYAKIKLL